jgi:hypothetical protein
LLHLLLALLLHLLLARSRLLRLPRLALLPGPLRSGDARLCLTPGRVALSAGQSRQQKQERDRNYGGSDPPSHRVSPARVCLPGHFVLPFKTAKSIAGKP